MGWIVSFTTSAKGHGKKVLHLSHYLIGPKESMGNDRNETPLFLKIKLYFIRYQLVISYYHKHVEVGGPFREGFFYLALPFD